MFSKKMMKKINLEDVIICILVLVLVCLVIYYVNKNNEGFESPKVMNFFYVDWCGHCKNTKPIIAKIAQKLESNPKYQVNQINCEGTDEEKALAEQADIKGFPTIHINGVEHQGPRDYESLMKALTL